MVETFTKLQRECREISLDQEEKTVSVLSKNIEVGLREKAKALIQLTEVKRTLGEDYDKSLKVLNRVKHSLKAVEEEKDFEEIPEEVDIELYRVHNPSATKRFMNSFQDAKKTRSQVFEQEQSEFTKGIEEFHSKKKNVSVSCHKSATQSEMKSLPPKAKFMPEGALK